MPTEIHFGTSGWRAIVADEFTIPNIRRAVAGIARYVSKQPGSHRILVGRDPRFKFLSRKPRACWPITASFRK